MNYGQMMQQRNDGQAMSNFGIQNTGSITLPSQSMIWVNGEQAAWDYLVAPNNAVHLRDSTQPRLYVKRADSSGKPSLQIFDLVERAAQPNMPPATSQVTAVVTRDEFDVLRKDMETLKDQYRELRKSYGEGVRKNESSE